MEAKMRVSISVKAETVDYLWFKGEICIAENTTFTYDLFFLEPFEKCEELILLVDPKRVLGSVILTLKKNGEFINLVADDEYIHFLNIIMDAVEEIYLAYMRGERFHSRSASVIGAITIDPEVFRFLVDPRLNCLLINNEVDKRNVVH